MKYAEHSTNPFHNLRLAPPADLNGGLAHSNLPGGSGPIMQQIRMADLDWEGAMPVKSIGFRILIPVPNLGAENETHTIENWKGEKEFVTGFKFRNLTDSADQAVVGDGKGVIIVALDSEKSDIHDTTQAIFTKVMELGGVENLNTEKLNALLSYVYKSLVISDVYNSDDSITESMVSQAGYTAEGSRPFGLYEKIDKPGPVAVYISRPAVVLDGPHAGTAKYQQGFMAVRIPPKKAGQDFSYRSIAPDAVAYCYKNTDGEHLIFSQMPQR